MGGIGMSHFADILGLLDPNNRINEFTVRAGAGTTFPALTFKAVKGTTRLPVLDIQPDVNNTPDDFDRSRVYQWFKLRFPNGQEGWVRAHVVGISGDFSQWGYGVIPSPMHAFTFARDVSKRPQVVVQTGDTTVTVEPETVKVETPATTVTVTTQPATPTTTVITPTPTAPPVTTPPPVAPPVATPLPTTTPVSTRNLAYDRSRLYPVPMDKYVFVRGYQGPNGHDGVDYGGADGEPMFAGPMGGLVVRVMDCKNCVPDRPSTLMHGFSLGDTRIFSDPNWAFGYGHFVIVRYTHDQLPTATQNTLASLGFRGWHIYAMYAHLKYRSVNTNQTLTANQQIGANGNTGNSTGPHLHLELRASVNPTFPGWSQIRSGLVDPLIMFVR